MRLVGQRNEKRGGRHDFHLSRARASNGHCHGKSMANTVMELGSMRGDEFQDGTWCAFYRVLSLSDGIF